MEVNLFQDVQTETYGVFLNFILKSIDKVRYWEIKAVNLLSKLREEPLS